MPQIKRVEDKWKHLREGLFGNTEPFVTLEAVTTPIRYGLGEYGCTSLDQHGNMKWDAIESLSALAASTSYGSKDKIDTPEKAAALNRKLIQLGHTVPLEAIQFNFHISGISKTCGAQLSRHRCGQGHVSASRRFKKAMPRYVYPTLDYFEHESQVNVIFNLLSHQNEMAFLKYQELLKGEVYPKLHKEDARMILAVSYATERSQWMNARALRDLFRLRLASDSEWEIRRLAWMIFDLVKPLMPSLFDDIV